MPATSITFLVLIFGENWIGEVPMGQTFVQRLL